MLELAIQILIAGQDRTQYVDQSTFRVENTMVLKSDTLSFEITCDGSFMRPLGGNEVVVWNGATKDFGGVIVTVEEDLVAPGVMAYHVTAKDYSQWFDHHQVQDTFSSQPADQVVRAIVQNYANQSGVTFTTNHVQPSFTIAPQTFVYVYPSDAIQQIASLLEWQFWIDYDKDVHFVALESSVSPLPGNILNLDTDTVNYSDCALSEDVSQLKNRFFMRGFKTRSSGVQPFSFQGDGVTTWFPLGYSAWSTDPTDMEVLINGAPQDVLTDNVDGQAGDGKTNPGAYVCYDNQGIRFNTAPPVGSTVSGNLHYAFDAATVIDDPESQLRMAEREGTDGVYEYSIEDPSLSSPSMDTATAKGQLMVLKYGYPKLTGKLYSMLQGWRAGQYFQITSAYRMKSPEGPLNQRVYVTKVVKTITTTTEPPVMRYEVSISDSLAVI